jgi:hypothetical protein
MSSAIRTVGNWSLVFGMVPPGVRVLPNVALSSYVFRIAWSFG